jgi:hypothetical protein
MSAQGRTVEHKVATLASRNHGVVTREQLLGAGLTRHQIARRLERGSLIAVYPGVYRVGHRAPSVEALYLAAVRACGDGALLNGRAAAHLYGLTKGSAPPPTVMTPTQRRVPGILTSRSRRMDPKDGTTYRGIPITTVARTLVDLAAVLSADDLARACHEAGVKYRTTPRHVDAVLTRRPRTRGAAALRSILHGDTRVTLSKLEKAFVSLLIQHGLELPQTNRVRDGRRVDCHWPEQRVTVELLSYQFHNSRYSFEQDHRRAREARARGDEFRSYTYEDVFEDPSAMLRELRELIPPAPRASSSAAAPSRAARGRGRSRRRAARSSGGPR